MKKLFVLALAVCAAHIAEAQTEEVAGIPEGYEAVDTVIYRPVDLYDKNLVAKDIFEYVQSGSGKIRVMQDKAVKEGMYRHITSNGVRKLQGYRVRIYYENTQDSRTASENAARTFEGSFPGYTAYRTFSNPFFQVTVGDFRTKSEALALLERVRGSFPSAAVVRETICFPVVDRKNAYIIDTVRIIRPIGGSVTAL